jgi:hypothetical protein
MRNDLIWSARRARVARTVCSGLLLFGSNLLAAEMQIIMLSEEAPAASDPAIYYPRTDTKAGAALRC